MGTQPSNKQSMEFCTNKYSFFLLLVPHSKRSLFPNETCNKYYLVRKPKFLESETSFISSDVVIPNNKYLLGLHFLFLAQTPKIFDISCAESVKDIFCYVNEMTFRNYLKMGAGCQGRDGTLNPTHSLLGGEMDCRLSSVTNVQSLNQPTHGRKPP